MSNAQKILVVDGDPVARKRLEQFLSGKGYAVTTAANGEDALWQLGNGTFDALFTDIGLRGMSGLDVAEEIHASQPGLPVVIITGDSSEAARKRAAAAGVAAYLHKPLSPEQLAETADRVLPVTASDLALQPQASIAEIAPSQEISMAVLRLKNIFLFLLAPFIGLAYLLAFPVFALGMALWMALQKSEDAETLHPAVPAKQGVLRTIAMMPAAILIGVFYAVAGPILGIGVLLSFGFQAWGRVGAKAIRA